MKRLLPVVISLIILLLIGGVALLAWRWDAPGLQVLCEQFGLGCQRQAFPVAEVQPDSELGIEHGIALSLEARYDWIDVLGVSKDHNTVAISIDATPFYAVEEDSAEELWAVLQMQRLQEAIWYELRVLVDESTQYVVVSFVSLDPEVDARYAFEAMLQCDGPAWLAGKQKCELHSFGGYLSPDSVRWAGRE